MDRGLWARWYDLEASGKNEYLSWLHQVHLPAMLARPGYQWAAHVENVVSAEREARNYARLTHVDDPSVPTGFGYLLLYGASSPHVFVDPTPSANLADPSDWTRRVVGNLVHAPHSPTLAHLASRSGRVTRTSTCRACKSFACRRR